MFLKNIPIRDFEKILFFEHNPIFEIHKTATVITAQI